MQKKYLWFAAPVLVVVGLVIVAFLKDSRTNKVILHLGEQNKQRLEILASIQNTDPIKDEMELRLDFIAVGDELIDANTNQLRQDIYLVANGADKTEFVFKKGQRLSATYMTFGLYDGSYTSYPFDQHKLDFELVAWVGSAHLDESKILPLYFELASHGQGFNVSAKEDPSSRSSEGYVAAELRVVRSATTILWAVFVMLLLWAMAWAVISVTHAFVTGKRKLEFGAFTWMGSMLFAFVGFRSAAPGAPLIGALIDVLAFFWAELIVATCLVITVFTYLQQKPEAKSLEISKQNPVQ